MKIDGIITASFDSHIRVNTYAAWVFLLMPPATFPATMKLEILV